MDRRILYHRIFSKQFARLNGKIRLKFIERRDLLLNDAHHSLLENHELGHEWAGCRGINITGDWRALFRAHPDGTIEFLAIGTHHQLYGQ